MELTFYQTGWNGNRYKILSNNRVLKTAAITNEAEKWLNRTEGRAGILGENNIIIISFIQRLNTNHISS